MQAARDAVGCSEELIRRVTERMVTERGMSREDALAMLSLPEVRVAMEAMAHETRVAVEDENMRVAVESPEQVGHSPDGDGDEGGDDIESQEPDLRFKVLGSFLRFKSTF